MLRALLLILAVLPAAGALAAVDIPANTWVQVTPTVDLAGQGGQYHERGWSTMIYSTVLGEMVSYEGYRNGGTHTGTIYSQAIWSYDVAANRVTLRKVNNWTTPGDGNNNTSPLPENAGDPTPSDRHPYRGMAEVPSRNGMYLWGGANRTLGSHPIDTWRFNFGQSDWTQLISGANSNLPVMVESQMAYDPQNDRLILYGHASNGNGGTWLYSFQNNSWSGPFNEGAGVVKAGEMVWDPVRNRMLLIGGSFATGGSSLYAYENGSWNLIQVQNQPPPRRMMGFAYDSRNDIFLLFGGKVASSSDVLNDTWAFLPDDNRWVQMTPSAVPTGSPAHVDMDYDPGEDVFVVRYGPVSSPVWWLYRYGTAPPPDDPPPAPQNTRAQ
ncbi:hypothetical protein ABI59_19340 [Acidobacteria bacterium Mor1]|nr:hypothetical protein ABI59_19340 [Acidobacteria bacterium Mor1]